MTYDKHHPERRRFYRILDDVYLQVEENENSTGELTEISQAALYPFINEFRKIEAESRHHLHLIEKNDPTTASYLQALNRKLDCLAQAILFSQEDKQQQRNCKVQLSEGGFSTKLAQPRTVSETVSCKMILFPDRHILLFEANVVYCNAISATVDGTQLPQYQTGFEFLQLKDGDAQLLARHIIHIQANSRRKNRLQETNEATQQ